LSGGAGGGARRMHKALQEACQTVKMADFREAEKIFARHRTCLPPKIGKICRLFGVDVREIRGKSRLAQAATVNLARLRLCSCNFPRGGLFAFIPTL
jgi:hypothetical protein